MAAKNSNLVGTGFHTNPERINKKGRPKKLPELEKLLEEHLTAGKDKTQAIDAIMKKVVAMAKKGNLRAVEIILERCYGKAKEHVTLKSDRKTVIRIGYGDHPDEIISEGAPVQKIKVGYTQE